MICDVVADVELLPCAHKCKLLISSCIDLLLHALAPPCELYSLHVLQYLVRDLESLVLDLLLLFVELADPPRHNDLVDN